MFFSYWIFLILDSIWWSIENTSSTGQYPGAIVIIYIRNKQHAEAEKTGILTEWFVAGVILRQNPLLSASWSSCYCYISRLMIQWCIIWVVFMAQWGREQVVEKMLEFPLTHESNRKPLCLQVPLRKCWKHHGRSPEVPDRAARVRISLAAVLQECTACHKAEWQMTGTEKMGGRWLWDETLHMAVKCSMVPLENTASSFWTPVEI